MVAHPARLTVRLGTEDPADVAVVGGKAQSLDRLSRLGHRVPAAVSITADAFRLQLQSTIESSPGARAWLADLPDETARLRLIDAFAGTPTHPALHAAIEDAVRTVGNDLAAETADEGPEGRLGGRAPTRLAVRSSALDEDGSTSSFAGLHETELGLEPGEVEDAVRRCWLSLWSAPAMAYRSRRGLDCTNLAMAVVVQALVPADASAVVFTRHPVTGRDDHVLITAIRGLGEPMVSGTATPDTIVVDRASRAVLSWDHGAPGPRRFVGAAGVIDMDDPGTGPALDGDGLDELVRLAIEVDEAYGARVDIEAARAADRWFLLQARPITTR
jgi:rifampicin phosphotransferase